MNKHFVVNLVLALFCLAAHKPLLAQVAGVEPYSKVDSKMLFFSQQHAGRFDTLVHFVNSNFAGNKEKIRAYYAWVAQNIAYDKELLDNYKLTAGLGLVSLASLHTQQPDTVLKYKKAVCEGYSQLMNKLCEASGITCKMVVGTTRLEDGGVVDGMLHAWNVVKLDTAWYLLDITWSNGYVDQHNQFRKKFSDHYFFSPPTEFVKDHWPLDPMWQLNYYPVSKATFYEGRSTTAPYFNYKDSIAQYLKLKADTVEYVNFLHYHWADPTNALYTKECDRLLHDRVVKYFNLAAVYYDDYQAYVNKQQGKQITEKMLKQCIKLLQDPKKYLELGLNYAKGKTYFYPEIKANVDEMVAASNKNLGEVNSFLTNYRKMLKLLQANKQ